MLDERPGGGTAGLPGGTAGAPLDRASAWVFIGGLHDSLWLSRFALLAAAVLAAILGRSGRAHRPVALTNSPC